MDEKKSKVLIAVIAGTVIIAGIVGAIIAKDTNVAFYGF